MSVRLSILIELPLLRRLDRLCCTVETDAHAQPLPTANGRRPGFGLHPTALDEAASRPTLSGTENVVHPTQSASVKNARSKFCTHILAEVAASRQLANSETCPRTPSHAPETPDQPLLRVPTRYSRQPPFLQGVYRRRLIEAPSTLARWRYMDDGRLSLALTRIPWACQMVLARRLVVD